MFEKNTHTLNTQQNSREVFASQAELTRTDLNQKQNEKDTYWSRQLN